MKKIPKKGGGKLLPQKTEVAKLLKGIAPNVSAEDRTAVCTLLDISKSTICVYLNGQVSNTDLGLSIYGVLKMRIEKRGSLIKSLCEL